MNKKIKKGGEKSPSPKGDTTQTRRQSKRRARLNEIAIQAGYESWGKYETAVINEKVKLQKHKNKY